MNYVLFKWNYMHNIIEASLPWQKIGLFLANNVHHRYVHVYSWQDEEDHTKIEILLLALFFKKLYGHFNSVN